MDIKQRRRLTDLYTRGEDLVLEEAVEAVEATETNPAVEAEEALTVWVRKMTPADAETAYVKANSRRSSVLAMAKEEEPSDVYQMMVGEVDQLSREARINFVSGTLLAEKLPSIEAEVAGEDKWSEEKFLTSLQERALEDDFVALAEENPEDPEVVRVLGVIETFQSEVADKVTEESGEIEAMLEMETDEDLHKRVIKIMLEAQGDSAWLNEFIRCQIWRCVFWDDHKTRVFPDRADVDDVQGELLGKLREAIDRIHVGDQEGKD